MNSTYNESPRIKIYHSIKERLLSNICELTDVRLWNNHVLNGTEKEPFTAPIVFIDWTSDIDYEVLSDGLKNATCEIGIKLLIQGFNLDKLQIYCLADAIKSLLDGWTNWNGSPLTINRVNEEPEFDDKKLINIYFNASWYEWSTPISLIPIGGTSGINYGICVSFEMDSNSDNQFLRGGTNFHAGFCLASTAGSGTSGLTFNQFVQTINTDPDKVTDLIDDNELPDWSNTSYYPKDDLGI